MSNNYLEMSDEDFAQQLPPEIEPQKEEPVVPEEGVTGIPGPANLEVVETEDTGKDPEQKVDDPENVENTNQEGEPNTEGQEPVNKEEVIPTQEKETTQEEVDYKSFHEAITAEFKAVGKQFKVKDANEARQLMQMGLDYTQKMQNLAPHRKLLMTLQNAGLTDEAQINYAIDLINKKPEAIQKLIHESGIDPLTINTDTPPEYQAGNHFVSDQLVSFQSQLDTLNATPEGAETLNVIHSWDQASKGEVLKNPQSLNIIHQQRINGVYDTVAAEVQRLKMLGQIGYDVPFIQAYQYVGNMLENQGAFKQPEPTPAAPVATKVVAPAPQVQNNERAEAAAVSGNAAKPTKTMVNPLSLSDDDFAKQWESFKKTM
ncbi:tail length tape measure protein [Alcaligenes phage vB_Af_QDWS595]|uniref:Major coat protein n=1 Tax=Alcaligenes phage vB_Af_QDWS595 TaxID=2877946 RepID=A0AAE8Y1D5_9CAUD|nr:tail length tape measure protein [Alcaligenes phage vB_Af_QDWS595]UCR75501.1 major coat protein [Alcaligenes phage vB_Af_QDWS595]